MAHGRDKPKKEKRKQKKDKQSVVKSTRDTEVLDHVRQHNGGTPSPRPSEES